MRLHARSVLLLATVLAASAVPATAQTRLDAHRTLGAPKTYRNLTLIPVFDSAARSRQRYMTLDEGLTAKLVTVEEAPSGGEVNTLFVTNRGRDPLYLMAGEVVLGGQQDRCLGRDTIVPPGSVKFAVPVFCVEHGRWNGDVRFVESAKAVASAGIRASAQNGAFAAPALTAAAAPNAPAQLAQQPAPLPAVSGGRPGRVSTRNADVARQQQVAANAAARVGEAQRQVWDSVAAKNRAFKAAPATGTYRQVLNQSGGQQVVAPYEKALANALGSDRHLAGVVAAVNGKVVAADLFGDPVLFRKLWPKLLRSYAADAAESAPAARTKIATVTPAQVKTFLEAARHAPAVAGEKTRTTTLLRQESKEAVLYRLVPNQAAGKSAAGVAGGGFGGAVHEGVIRK